MFKIYVTTRNKMAFCMLWFSILNGHLCRCQFHQHFATECVSDLDYCTEIIIKGSILTTLKLSIIFRGSWGSSVNWLKAKIEPTSTILACSETLCSRCQFHQHFKSSFWVPKCFADFMCLQFVHVIFCQNEIGAKAAY